MIRVAMVGLEGYLATRLSRTLESGGCESIVTRDEQQALALIREGGADAVLAGRLAPDAWIESCAALIHERQIAIIAIRGADGDRRAAALGSGADDCLSDPVNPQELLVRIRGLLRRLRC